MMFVFFAVIIAYHHVTQLVDVLVHTLGLPHIVHIWIKEYLVGSSISLFRIHPVPDLHRSNPDGNSSPSST